MQLVLVSNAMELAVSVIGLLKRRIGVLFVFVHRVFHHAMSLTRVLLSSLAHLGSFTAVREDRLELVHGRGLIHDLLPSLKQLRPCITNPTIQEESVTQRMAIYCSTHTRHPNR